MITVLVTVGIGWFIARQAASFHDAIQTTGKAYAEAIKTLQPTPSQHTTKNVTSQGRARA